MSLIGTVILDFEMIYRRRGVSIFSFLQPLLIILLIFPCDSWIADKSESNEEIPEKPPVTVSINEKSETSLAKPDLDSRLSEKFLVPSKTPDNGQTEYDGERFDRSPWSFSGDSLLFQTPKPTGNATSLAKVIECLTLLGGGGGGGGRIAYRIIIG